MSASRKNTLEKSNQSHEQPIIAIAPKLIVASSPVMAHSRALMDVGACVMKVGFVTSNCSSVEAMTAVAKLATRLTVSRKLKRGFSYGCT